MSISKSVHHRGQVDGLLIVCAQGYILVQLKMSPSSPEETKNDCEGGKSEVQSPPDQETQASEESADVRDCVLSPVSETGDIREGWRDKSRAEGDNVQMGRRGEEYTTSNGKSP